MLTLTNAATNIVFDGNSLFAGAATTTANRIGEKLMQLAPISGAMTYQNIAINGQTFRKMIGLDGGSLSDVHSAYQAGKQNLLFILEGVNTALTARPDGSDCTAQNIIDDCKAYIKAVKAVHPDWRVYIVLAFPYNGSITTIPGNASIDGYNAYVRSNYNDLGAEGYIETRPVSGPIPWAPPYTWDNTNHSGYYQDDIHLNATGNQVIAQYMADMLPSIPATAPAPAPAGNTRSGILLVSGKPLINAGNPLRVS